MNACPPLQNSPVQYLLGLTSEIFQRRTYCILNPRKNLRSRHSASHGQLEPFIMSVQRIDTP